MISTSIKPATEGGKTGPNPIDLHVGARVRLRRKALGVSQETLAEAIDLTFQQVQKYERGSNRISASKLFEICQALNTVPGYFFEGLSYSQGADASAEKEAHHFLMTTEGFELAQVFPKIKTANGRRLILALAKEMAES